MVNQLWISVLNDHKVRAVCDKQAGCGEGPVWDERTGRMWWVDISRKCIHSHDPESGRNDCYDAPCLVSSLVLAPSGLLIATEHGISHLNTTDVIVSPPVHNPEPNLPDNRLNDMAVAPDGSLWAGTMNNDAVSTTGSLYQYQDGGVQRMMSGLMISNGIGWSVDYSCLYFIDSGPGVVHALQHGTWRVLKQFTQEEGKPDGLAVDGDDTLWIALCGGGKVIGLSPSGEVIDTIPMPCHLVTSCAFGAKDLKTLFITTATYDMDDAQISENPLAGRLFSVEMKTPGQSSNVALWPALDFT